MRCWRTSTTWSILGRRMTKYGLRKNGSWPERLRHEFRRGVRESGRTTLHGTKINAVRVGDVNLVEEALKVRNWSRQSEKGKERESTVLYETFPALSGNQIHFFCCHCRRYRYSIVMSFRLFFVPV